MDFDAKNYVKKSALLRVSAIGDVLGPALDGLDDLLRLPTGCGEQNMVWKWFCGGTPSDGRSTGKSTGCFLVCKSMGNLYYLMVRITWEVKESATVMQLRCKMFMCILLNLRNRIYRFS